MWQWNELPLSDCVRNTVAVFGGTFVTGEPQQRMQAFLDCRLAPPSA